MLQQHPSLSGGAGVPASDPREAPSYVQICRDRPNEGITAVEEMRVDAGIILDEGASIQPYGRVGVQKLAGGVYAVFHHHGRRREAMWQAIYRCWLPQSELRLRDAPPYAESATFPVLRRGRDEDVTIFVPIHGSLYELQKKEKQMSPTVQTTELPDRQMLSITRHVYIGELKNHLRESCEQLAALIAETGVERDGKPVAIYHGHVSEENNGPVEVGIPVKTAPAVSGDIKSATLDGGSVAYIELILRQAHFPEILGHYDTVYKWIEENSLQIAGSPREVYMTTPMDKKAEMDQPFLEIVWPYK
jgi:DNA gyrase inhibitor GyrI